MRFAHLRKPDSPATSRALLALVTEANEAIFLEDHFADAPRDLQDLLERGAEAIDELREWSAGYTGSAIDVTTLSHESAVLRPPAIYAVGLNYRAHADELNIQSSQSPTVFALWPNSLAGHGGTTRWPEALSREVDYEVELAVIIGREVRDVPAADALDYVFGYTIMNDITARNIQFAEQQWSRAKSFDGFTPCGPVAVTADEIDDPQKLRITTTLNGDTVQDGNTSGMVRTVAQLISYLSRSATLQVGTVITTGTTSGAGYSRDPQIFLEDGSVVTCEIEGIGQLTTHTRVLP